MIINLPLWLSASTYKQLFQSNSSGEFLIDIILHWTAFLCVVITSCCDHTLNINIWWHIWVCLWYKALYILLSTLTPIDSKLCHQAVWISWRPWLVLVACQVPNTGKCATFTPSIINCVPNIVTNPHAHHENYLICMLQCVQTYFYRNHYQKHHALYVGNRI